MKLATFCKAFAFPHRSLHSLRALTKPDKFLQPGSPNLTYPRQFFWSPYFSTATTMSSSTPITLSSLKFIKPAALAGWLRDPATASSVAVIDVRDSDHVGGHIRNSLWVPTDQLDVRLPELLRTLRGKDKVVVHCMLSQQRGPKAALQYARARAYDEDKRRKEQQAGNHAGSDEKETEESKSQQSESDQAASLNGRIGGQEICVLEGGFGSWAQLYGEDATLTDAYAKDLWE